MDISKISLFLCAAASTTVFAGIDGTCTTPSGERGRWMGEGSGCVSNSSSSGQDQVTEYVINCQVPENSCHHTCLEELRKYDIKYNQNFYSKRLASCNKNNGGYGVIGKPHISAYHKRRMRERFVQEIYNQGTNKNLTEKDIQSIFNAYGHEDWFSAPTPVGN